MDITKHYYNNNTSSTPANDSLQTRRPYNDEKYMAWRVDVLHIGSKVCKNTRNKNIWPADQKDQENEDTCSPLENS